jgi:hypothetical protein
MVVVALVVVLEDVFAVLVVVMEEGIMRTPRNSGCSGTDGRGGNGGRQGE